MHDISALSTRMSYRKSISIVTTLRKVLLKEGTGSRHTILSIATPFHVSPFILMRLYLLRSRIGRLFVISLLVLMVALRVFWVDLACASHSRLPISSHVSLTRTAKASGYPRRSPGA
jgi:hypothetical protein